MSLKRVCHYALTLLWNTFRGFPVTSDDTDYELLYDKSEDAIKMQEICRYNFRSDNWRFSYLISEEKKRLAEEENYKAFHSFDLQLKKMSERKQ